MKECFVPRSFKPNTLKRIEQANEIIERYQAMDLKLTLRQLYYQFVAANLIPNTEKSYKGLAAIVSDARLAGEIDWDAIEDRGRVAATPYEWSSIRAIVDASIRSYRCRRWEGQRNYAELWVEKQALAGVLEPLAEEFHVTLMVNKGYSSQSAMYESSRRFIAARERECVLFYVGDHDPSGEDMVRDIADRLRTFGAELDVHKVALTREQIDEYKPPPQPAKTTDSRYERYAEEHGKQSWEVDSLPPDVLTRIVRAALATAVDRATMDKLIAQEQRDKEAVRKAVDAALKPAGKAKR